MADIYLRHGLVADFGDALYCSRCPSCGEKVEWEAQFDADGTEYTANCCGQRLRMSPATVRISIEEQ